MSVEPYIRLDPTLLSILLMHKLDINDIGAHFVETTDKVRACPANFRYRKVRKDNVWVLRDFFPGTQIMFKMTVVYQTDEERVKYYNSCHMETYKPGEFGSAIWVNVKLIPTKLHSRVHIPYKDGQKYLMAKAANILIEDDITPEAFIKISTKPPRRMFPKGYKVENRTNKRHPHIHNKRARRSKDV
jgi:hypothetical protein